MLRMFFSVISDSNLWTLQFPILLLKPILFSMVILGLQCESCLDFDCQNGGICSKKHNGNLPSCSCPPGFSGEHCEKSECNAYCRNGKCSLNADNLEVCVCYPGYDGKKCDHDLCQDYCLNNGKYLQMVFILIFCCGFHFIFDLLPHHLFKGHVVELKRSHNASVLRDMAGHVVRLEGVFAWIKALVWWWMVKWSVNVHLDLVAPIAKQWENRVK